MADKIKLRIVFHIVIIVSVIIFICFLMQYNVLLHEIEIQYTGKFIQAFYMIQEPDFFRYFVGGICAGAVLISVSISDFLHRDEYGIHLTIISILVNVIVLIILIIVYSNPVFTSFMAVVGTGGVIIAAWNS